MDLVIRAAVLYFFVVVVMRVIGRRELSTLSPVDLVLLIVLGDAVQQGLTQDDYSLTGAVTVVTTIAILQVATSYLSFRSKRAKKLLEGEPVVIIEDGRLIERNMRRERLRAEDVAEEMRIEGIGSFSDVRWGILESNGQFSFVKNDSGG
jgi:uncharacterized membrane protein YcaP (DUF421 family)